MIKAKDWESKTDGHKRSKRIKREAQNDKQGAKSRFGPNHANLLAVLVATDVFLRCCSVYSIAAYHAPPATVKKMPTPLNAVMCRLKIITARPIVNTCFTFAATVIVNGPLFLLAVKLTTLRPNAMIPLMSSAKARFDVISSAPNRRTRSSSPVYQPKITHWMKASGLMRKSRSSGCSLIPRPPVPGV